MAKRGTKVFTVYDMMDARGVFEENPANSSAPDYVKQDFPKMYYHPKGEMRITVPAEIIVTPMGAKEVGQQKETIWQIAQTPEEGKKLEDAGWHSSLGTAMEAAGKEAPPVSAAETVSKLENENASLREKLAEFEKFMEEQRALTGKTESAPASKPKGL